MSVELAQLEKVVATALCSADPAAALRTAQEDPALPAAIRTALAHANTDGFAISALLIARLRFERLMQGCPLAIHWYASNAEEFTAAFKRYHTSTPSRFLMPSEEAATFERWFGEDSQ